MDQSDSVLSPRGMEKGTSLNSTCLPPKPLASSVYVRVPEAPSPHERSISMMSLFPSPECSVGSGLNRCSKLERKRSFRGDDPPLGVAANVRPEFVEGRRCRQQSLLFDPVGWSDERRLDHQQEESLFGQGRRQQWLGRRSARVLSSSGVLKRSRLYSHRSRSIRLLTWCRCYTCCRGGGARVRPC
jgi:hypothetical protein